MADSGPVETVLDITEKAARSAQKFKTIADQFIDDWGLRPQKRVDAGVAGNPPAPKISDYPSQWSKESLDQKIQAVRTDASALGTQIKGLFNLAYESPTGGQTAAPIPSPAVANHVAISPLLIIGVIGLLIFMGKK